jgi:hypothetical protein
MITTLSILGSILFIYGFFKLFTFTPKTNIFYLVRLFQKEYRSIHIVGKDNDSGALTWLFRPFESVPKFSFKFKKLVTKAEAIEKKWPITYEINNYEIVGGKKELLLNNDKKVIVEREEEVPGYRAIELHPIAVDFVTEDGIDISSIVECAYEPEDPVKMKTSLKNWLDFAETQTHNIISAWGRKNKTDESVLNVSISEIMQGIASDVLKKDTKVDPGETVLNYLNDLFIPYGFKIANITLYLMVNGPQSQDVKDKKEAIKKADLDFERSKKERDTAYQQGMAKVDLKNQELLNEAKYIDSVTKDDNKTSLAVAKELGNGSINTLVLGEGFNTGAFTGTKTGIESTKKGGKDV